MSGKPKILVVRDTPQQRELPPEVLVLLSERGITLGIDIFCEADPRGVEALQQRLEET